MPTMVGMGKHARKLVVALHVVSSVGWMSQAVALLALLLASATAEPGQIKEFAAYGAEYLDAHVLVFLANTAAFTGLLLAAATPWGFVRHWWVATKLVLTTGQIYVAIAVLSVALRETAAAAEVGQDGPVLAVAVGAGAMASALAFQVWLSVAKPWGRTPAFRPADRGVTAPAWVFVVGVVSPVVDVAVGIALGSPLPAFSLLTLLVVLGRPWTWTQAQRPMVSSSRP